MKTNYLLILICLFMTINIFGQKMPISDFYDGHSMTSLGIATNLEQAYLFFDEAVQLQINEKEFSIKTTSGFSNSDTILELLKVDSCKTCFFYDKYILNISKGLSVGNYRNLAKYARKNSDNNYMNQSFYGSLLLLLRNISNSKIQNENISIREKELFQTFLDELILWTVESGGVAIFQVDGYKQSLTNESVIDAAIQQLKDPKYPPYLFEQYMEDNKEKWNPVLIDTTGIPEEYKKDDHYYRCPRQDTLCLKYKKILNRFNIYSLMAKEQGVTPEQALYNEVAKQYYRTGYKKFNFMIDFAIKENDKRLLSAIKEFIKENPDYELAEQQRIFFSGYK